MPDTTDILNLQSVENLVGVERYKAALISIDMELPLIQRGWGCQDIVEMGGS